MADETVNQQNPATPTPSSDAPTQNNSEHGGQQQGTQQNDNPSWLPERLSRAKEQAIKSMLSDLGFEKADDLKALVTDMRKRQEAEMSEAERLKSALEKAEARAKAAQEQAESIAAARIQDKVDAAIRTAAITARAEHPDDVIELLRKQHPDDVAKVLGADGNVDETAVKKLIEAARKARPNYFAPSGPGSPSNRNGLNPEPNADLKKEAKKELRSQIRRMT